MRERVRLGIGRRMIPLPVALVKYLVRKEAKNADKMLGRWTEDHHRVRDFVVRELHRQQEPFSPTFISQQLNLTLEQTQNILDELERGMVFLFQAGGENVIWAYPVTRAETPHKIAYAGTDEQGFAAGAVDAIATPFVQGQLRQETQSLTVTTECAQSHRAIHIEIDSNLIFRVHEEDADPWVYLPLVDFGTLKEPSITDVFGHKSVFFWSEEQARQHRREMEQERGLYLNIALATYFMRVTQSGVFGFPRKPGGGFLLCSLAIVVTEMSPSTLRQRIGSSVNPRMVRKLTFGGDELGCKVLQSGDAK